MKLSEIKYAFEKFSRYSAQAMDDLRNSNSHDARLIYSHSGAIVAYDMCCKYIDGLINKYGDVTIGDETET